MVRPLPLERGILSRQPRAIPASLSDDVLQLNNWFRDFTSIHQWERERETDDRTSDANPVMFFNNRSQHTYVGAKVFRVNLELITPYILNYSYVVTVKHYSLVRKLDSHLEAKSHMESMFDDEQQVLRNFLCEPASVRSGLRDRFILNVTGPSSSVRHINAGTWLVESRVVVRGCSSSGSPRIRSFLHRKRL